MPPTPFVVEGRVSLPQYSSEQKAVVEFSTTGGTVVHQIVTDNEGFYQTDLATVGYTVGETVTVSAKDTFRNYSGTASVVASGGGATVNILLTPLKVDQGVSGRGQVQLASIGGKPVGKDNPLHVATELSEKSVLFSDVGNLKVVKGTGNGSGNVDIQLDLSSFNTTRYPVLALVQAVAPGNDATVSFYKSGTVSAENRVGGVPYLITVPDGVCPLLVGGGMTDDTFTCRVYVTGSATDVYVTLFVKD